MKKVDTMGARIAFSQFVHRTLKTKTGASQSLTARVIYGYFMPLLATIPDRWQLWTDEIDRLPRGKSPAWYQAACRAIAEDAKQDARAEAADRRGMSQPELFALTAAIGKSA